LLQKFIEKKKKGDTQKKLISRYWIKNLWKEDLSFWGKTLGNQPGHIDLKKEHIKTFLITTNGDRPVVYLSGRKIIILLTSLVLYIDPSECWTSKDGVYYRKKHKTIYEFVEHHPSIPRGIFISPIFVTHPYVLP